MAERGSSLCERTTAASAAVVALVARRPVTTLAGVLAAAFVLPMVQPGVVLMLYPALITALAVGLYVQGRRVQRQHDELVALRDVDRRRAISDERRRIARDLHDVAAHHLSALVVRNRLAQRRGGVDALEDAAAFTAETAAATLDSLRQVVGVLSTEPEAPMAPPPSLADIDVVVGRMREAGLEVHRSPDVVPAPGGEAEVALVRIAQEALANVLRHRGPGRCWVELTRRGDQIALTVEDDGPSTPVAELEASPGRYGLIGMRERAEACGGRLDVGASSRGGWRVSAVVPAVAT